MTRTVLDQWLQYCLVRQWGCVERSETLQCPHDAFPGWLAILSPPFAKKGALWLQWVKNCIWFQWCWEMPLDWFFFSPFFFLIFLFYFFILSTEWGIWTLTPNCERPGNWWAKIHNRLILYIYMYKSPWTQWRISKTVYKGILIMRVNKHDLKIKLIWSLIFWSLSSQRGLRPSDKIWGA